MSLTIIFILCLINGLLANVTRQQNKNHEIEKIKFEFRACAIENNLNEDIVNIFINGGYIKNDMLPPEQSLNCTIACTLKKIGYILSNGTITLSEKQRNDLHWTPELIRACTQNAEENTCKLVGCLFKFHKLYESLEHVVALVKECYTANNIDERFTEFLIKNYTISQHVDEPPKLPNNMTLPSKEQLDCSAACVYRKQNAISSDGHVLLSEKQKMIVNWSSELINKCSVQAQGDICKLAGCLRPKYEQNE